MVTTISLIVIAAVFVVSFFYTIYAKRKNLLAKQRRIIDSLPGIVSALGVIGTFLGITLGLVDFDTSPAKIDNSIATLLKGLKTAFYTSLAGMSGSLILRFFVTDKLFDKEEEGVSTAELAAATICKQIEKMSGQISTAFNNNSVSNNSLASEIKQIKSSQAAFFNSIQTKLDNISTANIDNLNTNFETLVLLSRSQEASLENISIISTDILAKANTIKNNTNDIEASISKIDGHVGDILDIESGNTGVFQNQLDETKKFSELLRSEVDDIEIHMANTNKLLTSKFDEFSELLKKSNTEALVEVMKAVTVEFQTQMNSLINKLIQENFDQLNKSVEQLNDWQKENKEMIASLTEQYHKMTVEFTNTSSLLSKVSSDTKQLVSDGGKLQKLIEQLNKVMIEDKKFVEITTKLENAASTANDSMIKFDESNKKLNDWIQKHKNFVEEVQKLVVKLDELNKIRDYSEQFWQDTKRGMNEGVAIIKQGSETLNSQLTQLDRQFYTRLSATLAELDTCIQAMING